MSDDHLTYKFLDLHFSYDGREADNVFKTVVSNQEKVRLRTLASRVAEIAALPIQQKRKKQWQERNDLVAGKPMLAIDEICWHEFITDDLKMQTKSSFARGIEAKLLQTLYKWNNLQLDMVVEPVIYSPMAITNTGVGLGKDADIKASDESNDVVSHKYKIQIKDEEDIEKLLMPKIIHDEKLSAHTYNLYNDIFGGILNVEQRGAPGFWYAPWDDIVMWTGVQEVLLDLLMRPDYVHKLMNRLTDISTHVLDEYEKLNLLAMNNYNVRVGSGSYGYTNDLKNDGEKLTAKSLWGNATPQIFSSVSPEMHKEFALDYEKKWLERFGLSYYGCCEPLHDKIEILSEIKNLRKISFSPWADIEIAAEQCTGKYVMSIKPSPSVFAQSTWDPANVRKELEGIVSTVKKYNCSSEIIIKDISTVNYKPERLWEWTKIASEVADI